MARVPWHDAWQGCSDRVIIGRNVLFTLMFHDVVSSFAYVCLMYVDVFCASSSMVLNTYELQPKFRLMESSIRDVFIFRKLSWGLENHNTLFKER